VIDTAQARQLFEIRLMKWNGSIAFPDEWKDQMTVAFQSFGLSSSPSGIEIQIFQQIQEGLPCHVRSRLFHDYICDVSGREIDIAFITDHQKIAINVDGPTHYDPITHCRTLKTIFRDKCLQAAGWDQVIEVDVLRLVDNDQLQVKIGQILVLLIETESKETR